MAFRTGENFDGVSGVSSEEVFHVDQVELLNNQYSAEMRALESEAEELVRQGKATQDLEELMKIKTEKYTKDRNDLIDRSKIENKMTTLEQLNQKFSSEMRSLDAEAEALARKGLQTKEFEDAMEKRRNAYDEARSALMSNPSIADSIDVRASEISNEAIFPQEKHFIDEGSSPTSSILDEALDYPVLTDVVSKEEYERAFNESNKSEETLTSEQILETVDNAPPRFNVVDDIPVLGLDQVVDYPSNPASSSVKSQNKVAPRHSSWIKRIISNFLKNK